MSVTMPSSSVHTCKVGREKHITALWSLQMTPWQYQLRTAQEQAVRPAACKLHACAQRRRIFLRRIEIKGLGSPAAVPNGEARSRAAGQRLLLPPRVVPTAGTAVRAAAEERAGPDMLGCQHIIVSRCETILVQAKGSSVHCQCWRSVMQEPALRTAIMTSLTYRLDAKALQSVLGCGDEKHLRITPTCTCEHAARHATAMFGVMLLMRSARSFVCMQHESPRAWNMDCRKLRRRWNHKRSRAPDAALKAVASSSMNVGLLLYKAAYQGHETTTMQCIRLDGSRLYPHHLLQ